MPWLFPKTAAAWGPAMGNWTALWVAAGFAVVLSVVFAALLYLFVEQPCMRRPPDDSRDGHASPEQKQGRLFLAG
jgi:peptidoglycan/LPS O-acetylase OafA/YrhL